ncbi:MAG: membrane protein insertion efficiency factor YidD [Candidatus Neomarinimicrobiota bacterium]
MFLKSLPGQIVKRIFLIIIRGYQLTISPLIGPSCRFHPSCSNYAVEAIEKKSLFMAAYLIIFRLLRCNPFFKGGEDPVR